MNTEKLTEPINPPIPEQVEFFIGRENHELWRQLVNWISQNYPDVFSPEWIRSGKKSGWYLRYKKSKSFCQLIPRKNQFIVLVTFGGNEREKVEVIKEELSLQTQKEYNKAETFHDGKWLYLIVNNKSTLTDIQKLLSVKRKIKKKP
jgi:hypothetical protein